MSEASRLGLVFPGLLALFLPVHLHSQNGTGIVISQIYEGGGNQGALYRNDYVELFNRSGAPIDITGWTIQYASASGSFWVKTTLTGSIQPGRYYLIQEEQGNSGSVSLPSPDVIGGIGLSATDGKVALVRNSVNLTGTSPNSSDIVDFVGYGSASYSLGQPAGTLSNTTAALRAASGCSDSRNNSADFIVGAPVPRNSQSSRNLCVPTCTFSLSAYSATLPAGGGTFWINVTGSANCSWTATSLVSWVTITAGNNGSGLGTVVLNVLSNPSSQSRTSIITIAGNSFTVNQSNGLRFVPFTPCRLMETRADYNFENRTGSFGPPGLLAGETRTLTLSNASQRYLKF